MRGLLYSTAGWPMDTQCKGRKLPFSLRIREGCFVCFGAPLQCAFALLPLLPIRPFPCPRTSACGRIVASLRAPETMLNYRVDDVTGKVYDFRRQRTLMSTFTRPPWWGVQVIGNVAATAHRENNYDARAIARNTAISLLRTNAYYAVAVGLEQLAVHMLSPRRAVKYLKGARLGRW